MPWPIHPYEIIYRDPLRKPPAGNAELIRDHPLANGMKCCWLFNERGRPIAHNLVGEYSNAIYTAGSVTPATGPSGYGLKYTDGENERYVVSYSSNLWPTNQFSVACFATIYAVPTAGHYPVYFGNENSNRDLVCAYGYSDSLPNTLLNVGGSTRYFVPNSPPDIISCTVGTHHIGFTWDGVTSGVGTFYWNNDSSAYSLTFTGTITQTDANQEMMFGPLGGSEGWNAGNHIYYRIALWHRVLSVQEMLWLRTEPYCFVKWNTPKRYFFTTEAPSTPMPDKWWKQSSDPRRTSAEVVTY